MKDDQGALARLAAEPLDDVDAATLEQLRAAYQSADPVPAGLVERVHFALALDVMLEEVAGMTRVPLDASAVRSGATDVRTETLTFSADRLTAMVTVTRDDAGRLRLDGWLAPPAPLRVLLRLRGHGDREVLADDQGRFSFAGLGDGFAQLRFFAPALPEAGSADPGEAVVTPVFEL